MGSPAEKLVGLMIMLLMSTASVAAAAATSPDCDRQCGDVEIPYPFGMKKGCFLNETFFVKCNRTDHNPLKAFLGDSEVTNISIIHGELYILQQVAKDCYTKNGSNFYSTLNIKIPMFTISNTKNKFTVIGCDTYGLIRGTLEGESYVTGCMTLCANNSKTIKDGSCSGNGYCQLEIQKGLKDLSLVALSLDNHTGIVDFNPCRYAFVIQQDKFNFSSKYIRNFTQDKVPLVLDWTIPNNTSCSESHNNTNCSICGQNSEKINFFADGSEYRCRCKEGFEGNPYLRHGCQDIDECKNGSNKCKFKDRCVNTRGNYTCNCPKNYKGDGRRGEEGCTRNSTFFIQIIIGIGVGFTVLVIGSTWLYLFYKKWKFIRGKEEFFKKNGGLILQQHLSQWQSPVEMPRIFTREELEKATNKYEESAVVGKGGYGVVYKGVFDNGLTVAIKKSKLVDQSQTSQFVNEVIVLSQINHRHVVRLLGCCLETKVPLLVYEFIANGTLFEHIHDKTKHASLSWEARLKIASEIAGVLSYLHSSASTPVIHRDIKSTNILLDQDYTAKVSDFGASKLVPLNHTQISTMVQGTLGYLDPEYLLTSELTEKSDVYSFGIVLLELITGKKAVRFDGPEEERNLAMYVLCAMKEDRVEEVVEKGMATEENFEQIKEVGKLARECLRVKGDERPTMKEVAVGLEGLRLMKVKHSLATNNSLDATSDSSSYVVNDIVHAMDNSINAQILSHFPHGR